MFHLLSHPCLWSSGKEFLATDPVIQFDSQHYQIFWEVVGLERGPLSLVGSHLKEIVAALV
jgi:hypothetical protein